jgi:hypothetical protein
MPEADKDCIDVPVAKSVEIRIRGGPHWSLLTKNTPLTCYKFTIFFVNCKS